MKSSDTLLSLVNEMAEKLLEGGADSISYHITPAFHSQVSKLATVYHYGYTDHVVSKYLDPENFENDPIPDYVMSVGHSMTWRQALAEKKLNEDQVKFYKFCENEGLVDGVAIPLFGPNGMNSYLSLNFKKIIASEDVSIATTLAGIAQHFHRRICLIRKKERDLPSPLSTRESDVLYWMSRGKTNYEIGIILGVSETTIGTYVRRIFNKLDVNDRMSAVLSVLTFSTFTH